MIRKLYLAVFILTLASCGVGTEGEDRKIITVTIPPFRYFTEKIAGDDFEVNVMVPSGGNPHIYEPYPEQVVNLGKSVAYISNGFLGFEMAWLPRFSEVNSDMKILSLGDFMDPLDNHEHHEGEHHENADPHYWMSPGCARIMALQIKNFITEINPEGRDRYEANYFVLDSVINSVDSKAKELFAGSGNRSFMIYHPNLGYLAREYGLNEISVEYEGKEPPPSRLKYLIDLARKENIKIIFVQKEYDLKNAEAIAGETGAEIKVIDPLSENWEESLREIIVSLHESLVRGQN